MRIAAERSRAVVLLAVPITICLLLLLIDILFAVR